MTATFGDFLHPATAHINAVASHSDLPGSALAGVIRQLDRLAAALAHYLSDIAPPDKEVNRSATRLDPAARATIEARTAFRRAAHCLRRSALALGDTGQTADHPAVGYLTAAADNLGAGRDVLQSHFARGPFGGWEATSHWAPALTSRPLTTALMSELAAHAQTLAPWAARLSVSGHLDEDPPLQACLDLHAATRWLWIGGATIETALRDHPPSEQGRKLLDVIPANFPPPRRPPAGAETLPQLCEGITSTAERIRQAALAFTPRARWSPAANSTTWRKNALGSAVVCHASQAIMQALSTHAAQAHTSEGLQEVGLHLQDTCAAWQEVAHGWDLLSTGRQRNHRLSPVVGEFGDLAQRMTGLARHMSARVTAADRSADQVGRAPAPVTSSAAEVLAAVHNAVDALTRAGGEDHDAVRAFIASRRLYLPTRLMPADCDIPRAYTPAPRSTTSALLASYATAIKASTRALTALDSLAIALDAPSWPLAAIRQVPRRNRHGGLRGHPPGSVPALTLPGSPKLHVSVNSQTARQSVHRQSVRAQTTGRS